MPETRNLVNLLHFLFQMETLTRRQCADDISENVYANTRLYFPRILRSTKTPLAARPLRCLVRQTPRERQSTLPNVGCTLLHHFAVPRPFFAKSILHRHGHRSRTDEEIFLQVTKFSSSIRAVMLALANTYFFLEELQKFWKNCTRKNWQRRVTNTRKIWRKYVKIWNDCRRRRNGWVVFNYGSRKLIRMVRRVSSQKV